MVYTSLLLFALATTSINAVPLSKRIDQEISASTKKWEAACVAAGGGQQCNTVAVASFGTLLAAPGPCEQQNAGDKMVDLAKQLKNDPDMIKFAQIFVQQARNSPSSQSVPYCQQAPKNAELNGLFQCQFQGVDKKTFVGGLAVGAPGTMPFGMKAPLSPAGSCPANPNGPIADGAQLSDLVKDPGVGKGSAASKSASASATASEAPAATTSEVPAAAASVSGTEASTSESATESSTEASLSASFTSTPVAAVTTVTITVTPSASATATATATTSIDDGSCEVSPTDSSSSLPEETTLSPDSTSASSTATASATDSASPAATTSASIASSASSASATSPADNSSPAVAPPACAAKQKRAVSGVMSIYKRIAQADLPAVAQSWQDLCLVSGGDIKTNDPCVNLAGINGINGLLAGSDPCAQQDNADAMIDFAKSAGIKNKDALIANAVKYRQHARNALDIGGGLIPSTPFCQKAPKNAELKGLVNAQLNGVNPGLFGGPKFKVIPFGAAGSCPFGQKADVSTCTCA